MSNKQPRDFRKKRYTTHQKKRVKRTAEEIQEDMIQDPITGPAFEKIFETHVLVCIKQDIPVVVENNLSVSQRERTIFKDSCGKFCTSAEIDAYFIKVLKDCCGRKPYSNPTRSTIEQTGMNFNMSYTLARERFSRLVQSENN